MNSLFEDFSSELKTFLIRWIIQSKEIQRKHKFKDGEMVFYYDDHFSNIHKLELKNNSPFRDLTQEVLDNTKNYNNGKEWDLLTGIYMWLPRKKWVIKLVKNEKGNQTIVP